MKYTTVVKTLFGLEETLQEELKLLGIAEVKLLNRAVEFETDLEGIYRCNLHLRTALSVLSKVSTGEVQTKEELYALIRSIDWDDYFDLNNTIAVRVVTVSKTLDHSLYLEQTTKDAIVDFFREKYGSRPSVDVRNPEIKISIYLTDEKCEVYLDSSGKPLYFRGFNKEISQAPLNECLAAGIIYKSGWDTKSELIDPMCGSGTFLSEAYMMATNTPPTINRTDFCFKNWKNFDSSLWNDIRNNAKSKIIKTDANIIGSDINSESVSLTKSNLRKVDRNNNVKVFQKNFFTYKGFSNNGIIVCNPPYGVRMELSDSKAFYKRIGDKLKFDFSGYTAWIISSDLTASKFIGMKPDVRAIVYNGQLECRLLKFSIYKGSRKENYK